MSTQQKFKFAWFSLWTVLILYTLHNVLVIYMYNELLLDGKKLVPIQEQARLLEEENNTLRLELAKVMDYQYISNRAEDLGMKPLPPEKINFIVSNGK